MSSVDVRGNQLTEGAVFDGASHPTTFTYDTEDRIASRTDALGHRWQAGYDNRGNLRCESDVSDDKDPL